MDKLQGLDALSGSREPDPSCTGPGPSGFDPARIVEYIVPRLGKAQRRVLLSLTEDWGEAACHKTAKRMFWGVTDRDYTLVFHKHRTDNCWQLSDLGASVKAALAAGSGTAETSETSAQCEASQSGPQGQRPDNSDVQ